MCPNGCAEHPLSVYSSWDVYRWSGACFIDVARTCRVYYVNANQYSFHDQIATFSFQMNTE